MNPRTYPVLFAIWAIDALLKIVLARYAYTIRKQYPVFAIYTAFCAVTDVLLYTYGFTDYFSYFYAYYVVAFAESLLFLCFIVEICWIFFGRFIGLPRRTVSEFLGYTFGLLLLSLGVGVALGHTLYSVIGALRVAARCATYAEAVSLFALIYLIHRYRMPFRSRIYGMVVGSCVLIASNVIVNTVLPYCSFDVTMQVSYFVLAVEIAVNIAWLTYVVRPERLTATVSPRQAEQFAELLTAFQFQVKRINSSGHEKHAA